MSLLSQFDKFEESAIISLIEICKCVMAVGIFMVWLRVSRNSSGSRIPSKHTEGPQNLIWMSIE